MRWPFPELTADVTFCGIPLLRDAMAHTMGNTVYTLNCGCLWKNKHSLMANSISVLCLWVEGARANRGGISVDVHH